jgi:hypothetical protein
LNGAFARARDPAAPVARPDEIASEWGGRPRHINVRPIVETAWNCHRTHPDGYGPEPARLRATPRHPEDPAPVTADPFTAGRPRNAGLDRLPEREPSPRPVRLVDGDCKAVARRLDRARRGGLTEDNGEARPAPAGGPGA